MSLTCMGLLSSLLRTPEGAGERLAARCFWVRQELGFLQGYANDRVSSPLERMRLEFSKDVVLILLAIYQAETLEGDRSRLPRIIEHLRSHYLGLISVPSTSLLGECLICEDELQAVGTVVAPQASISKLRTALVSTKGLISLMVDHRAVELREAHVRGLLEMGHAHLLPVARTALWRIRGGSGQGIPFDDVNHFAVALTLPWLAVFREAQAVFR